MGTHANCHLADMKDTLTARHALCVSTGRLHFGVKSCASLCRCSTQPLPVYTYRDQHSAALLLLFRALHKFAHH
jgi:hypothetical protein